MSPKHVFKTNGNTICTVTVMRVLLLREGDGSGPVFWLYILACILCCLSALINIHAHVYKKPSNCVANSCFGKFSPQIAFKF